jgi:hypothetical protein
MKTNATHLELAIRIDANSIIVHLSAWFARFTAVPRSPFTPAPNFSYLVDFPKAIRRLKIHNL